MEQITRAALQAAYNVQIITNGFIQMGFDTENEVLTETISNLTDVLVGLYLPESERDKHRDNILEQILNVYENGVEATLKNIIDRYHTLKE